MDDSPKRSFLPILTFTVFLIFIGLIFVTVRSLNERLAFTPRAANRYIKIRVRDKNNKPFKAYSVGTAYCDAAAQPKHECKFGHRVSNSSDYDSPVGTIPADKEFVGAVVQTNGQNMKVTVVADTPNTSHLPGCYTLDKNTHYCAVRNKASLGASGNVLSVTFTVSSIAGINPTPTFPPPVCTPVPCTGGNLVCPEGNACQGGCGMVCGSITATPTPLYPGRITFDAEVKDEAGNPVIVKSMYRAACDSNTTPNKACDLNYDRNGTSSSIFPKDNTTRGFVGLGLLMRGTTGEELTLVRVKGDPATNTITTINNCHNKGADYKCFVWNDTTWTSGNRTMTVVVKPSTPDEEPTPTPDLGGDCPIHRSKGNANCDDKIDLIDFEIWRREYLGDLTTKDADFNNNGVVDFIDFEIWRSSAQENL